MNTASRAIVVVTLLFGVTSIAASARQAAPAAQAPGNALYYGYTVYDPTVLAEPWKVAPRAIQLNTSNAPYNEDPPCIMNPRPMVSRERG